MGTGDNDGATEVRQRVVEAARACFAESGLAGSTMKAVARRAEVTEGAVYYYFESKQALFEEVVREPLERLVDGLANSPDSTRSTNPDNAINQLNHRVFNTMLQVVPLYGVAVFSDVPQGKAWYSTVSSPLLEAGAEAAQRAIPDLRTDVPVDLLFRAMVGMHMGLAIDKLLGSEGEGAAEVRFDSLISLRGRISDGSPSEGRA